jgi:hypothetical protein
VNRPIVAYCSHSYRPEDRAVNMAVWQKLNAAGVVFAVDPPGSDQRPMDVTYIERMMLRADCFVAVVPDRARQVKPGTAAPPPSWSPYQALEYRFALRADKPRLVIAEHSCSQGPLPDGVALLRFHRLPLRLPDELDGEIQRLLGGARARALAPPAAPKIGLLRWRPAGAAWGTLLDALEAELTSEHCRIVEVHAGTKDHELIALARGFSMLVVDVNPEVLPSHVLGLLHGASVPLYRTCLLPASGDEAAWDARLGLAETKPAERLPAAAQVLGPRLLHGYKVDARMQPVLYWQPGAEAQAAAHIAETTRQYQLRERLLEEQGSGRDYFLSLSGNRVFISLRHEDLGGPDALPARVQPMLENAGMPAFHYRMTSMDAGREWQPQIAKKIESADLLLGFVTPGYWDSAECRDEIALAVERWERRQMLIVIYGSEPLPPLPPFLARLQVNRIADDPALAAAIVETLRRRFAEPEVDLPPEDEQRLTELVERHWPGDDAPGWARWLREKVAMPAADAEPQGQRIAVAARPAAELVRVLVEALRSNGDGRAALARLCYRLRGLEPKQRAWLSGLFSPLRLLPGLHDVRAWNARRQRREHVLTLRAGPAPALLKRLSSLGAAAVDPMAVVRDVGAEVADCLDVNALPPPTGGALRLVAASGIDDLAVPCEWAVLKGAANPLGLAGPLTRRIDDVRPPWQLQSLERAFHDGRTGPPRVLLFGHAPASLPNVAVELKGLHALLTELYQQRGWPTELVCCVPPEAATRDELCAQLQGVDHDLVHLAGHAGFDAQGEPGFEVLAEGSAPGWVGGDELGDWLRHGGVRFVYLNCCQGAAVAEGGARRAGWQQSLCKGLLEAGVPEILAYVWPVDDSDAAAFAHAFYEHYAKAFDAAGAVHHARTSVSRSRPVWAGSVLIQQLEAAGDAP